MPYDIVYRDFPESEAITTTISKYIEKIEKFGRNQIVSCHVVVAAPHRHHHKGKIYHIQIRMHVGNKDIIVDHEREQDHSHEEINVAIRDAFSAAERQLKDYVDKHKH